MVGTVESRFKKDPNYITGINTIVTDECHRLDFLKIFDIFPEARRIGFTATPVITKKGDSLKNYYTEMIEAPTTAELVKEGSLVPEAAYHLPLNAEDFSKLKASSSNGGFTQASMNAVFNQGLLIKQVFDYYTKYLNNQKTMIFCCSTKHMEETTQFFKDKGLNARSYGSKSKDSRAEVVNWIKNTEDAILISLDIFTAGFDVKDILGIILFRATTSLSLYLQMAGRGARTTDKVFKDHFKLIDFGGNIERFGLWSSLRDWQKHFENSKKKANGIAPVRVCPKCERINHATASECDECGFEFPKNNRDLYEENGDIKIVRVENFEFPEVSVHQLYNFCLKRQWKPARSMHLLMDANLRVLTVYDINKKRFQDDWKEIVNKIFDKFYPQFKVMVDLYQLTSTRTEAANKRYWKDQLWLKLLEHYNTKKFILKDFGEFPNLSND